jgi:hypothetical protein
VTPRIVYTAWSCFLIIGRVFFAFSYLRISQNWQPNSNRVHISRVRVFSGTKELRNSVSLPNLFKKV